jgi:hypothetical protein
MIPAFIRHRKSYINPIIPSDEEIDNILKVTDQKFPTMKFQITTRGGEVSVVKRGIKSIAEVAKSRTLFEDNFDLLIVTDEPDEIQIFSNFFQELEISFPAKTILVPLTYNTPNQTGLKARSLQFSVDYRRRNNDKPDDSQRSFIFYFDAESTIEITEFRRIIHSILVNPEKGIFEGPIIYPLKYFNSHIFSRQMEASRPFNCHHCVQVMKHPPPIHLHGSNLLVDEKIVNEIGWDFGQVDNHPLLAEDLMFGLKIYMKYGRKPFGWHGGRLLEQPPFTLRDSFNARTRWVTGAYQALKLLEKLPDFQNLALKEKLWLKFRIRFRLMTHSLSFFAALFVILSIILFILPPVFPILNINQSALSPSFRVFQFIITRFVLLPGTAFWIFGIVIGSMKNLEKVDGLTQLQKFIEIFKLILISPFAGAIESFSAFYASIRWLIGKPYNSWAVTRK